ncbi:MAG: cobalt transporter CbiM [Elusimicrobiota bacterium]
MHIPDGYLGPQTYITTYGAFVFFAAKALKKIKEKLDLKYIPYVAMASAFSFLIMMFNVPIPGGTTGHAVGSAIVALIVGWEAAVIAVSVALIIQAIVFADGGITAIGANCFNMAVVMPYVAWHVFKWIKGNSTSEKRYYIAAFIAEYVSLNIAALLTAIMFGIQPIIANENGVPLYSPYPLSVAIVAMMSEHLLLFGLIEGFVTAGVLKYFVNNKKDIIESLKQESV